MATQLTAPQLRVLALVAEGYTNRQIARETHLSAETVAQRLSSAYRRLGAHDRAHAVALAIRSGLLPGAPCRDHPPQQVVDPAMLGAAISAYRHGASLDVVAERLGISPTGARKLLLRAGVQMRRRGRPPTVPQEARS